MKRYWATMGAGVGALAGLTLVEGYQRSFLLLNGAAFALGDLVFPHLTHLGDGVVLTSLMTLVLWRIRPGMAATALAAMLVSALAVNVLKFWVFNEWRRPLGTFEPELVRMLGRAPEYYFSFPSGHSTSAGAGFTLLAFAFPRFGIVWAIAALLTAYSRIYVGSHFPGDVAAGLALGALCAVGTERAIRLRLENYFSSLEPLAALRLRTVVYVLASAALTLALSNRYFGGWVG